MGEYIFSASRSAPEILLLSPPKARKSSLFTRLSMKSMKMSPVAGPRQQPQTPSPSGSVVLPRVSVTVQGEDVLAGTGVELTDSEAGSGNGPSGTEGRRLRLYQILSPRLIGRAKVFGSKLALKEEWVCIDQPYFNALGGAICVKS